MAVSNLRKRGAVYWWRRLLKLPRFAQSTSLTISLELSLFTKELGTARGRSAALTAYSERLRMTFRNDVRTHGLGDDEQARIFVDEMKSYRNELVHLVATWKVDPRFKGVPEHDRDLAILGYLWQAVAQDGASQAREWEFVEKHFRSFDLETQHRLLSLLRSLHEMGAALKIDALDHLKAQDVAPHPTNLAVAIDLIARARNQAVQQFQGDFDQAGVWSATAGQIAHSPHSSVSTSVAPADDQQVSITVAAAPMLASATEPTQAATPVAVPTSIPGPWMDKTPLQMADIFIQEAFVKNDHRKGDKRQKRSVGDPTERDVRWAMLLVTQTIGEGKPLAAFTQDDLLTLDGLFSEIPTSYGKSPAHRLECVSLRESADRAAQMVSDGKMVMEDVGLRGPTCNKHLHNIRRVFELLRSKNQHLPALEIGKLLTPEDKLARESREQMSSEIARDIFKLPPWTGCHGPNKRLTKGAVILHDALFYVLILVWYTGARREEICKLMLDDVITTVIPHIKIRETETGRVKNANAVRDVPLHTELLRLGFLAYVEKMRAEGEKYLFPELYPQSQTKRSLGDVFYKLWWIYIKPLVSDLERGQAFHSVRHTVSDTFKQAGYSEEHRNDFLGHSQKDRGEGPDRYSNPLNLKAKQKMLKALIVVTNHLPDVTEITLLPTEMRQGRPSRQG